MISVNQNCFFIYKNEKKDLKVIRWRRSSVMERDQDSGVRQLNKSMESLSIDRPFGVYSQGERSIRQSEVGQIPADPQERYQLFKQLMKDMEFVQMLADPHYLIQLRERGYFYDTKFIQYINGLSYLFLPQYIKLIKYPQGLWTLKSLQSQGFVESTKKPETFARFLDFCKKRNDQIRKGYH